MKTLNGFEIVDAQAREDIEVLKNTEVDLSEYAKKSEIPDVSDFITNIPSEYITETELNAKGYLTEHQDISGKADKVHSHPEYLTEHQSLAGYATETFVTTKIAEAELGGEDVDLSGYATKQDISVVDAKIAAHDTRIGNLENAGYATKTYVDNAVANIEVPEGQAQKDTYFVVLPEKGATITDADTIEYLDRCLDPTDMPHGFVQYDIMNGKATDAITYIEHGLNNSLQLYTAMNISPIGAATTVTWIVNVVNKVDGVWTLTNKYEQSKRYATESYVNNAIENIDIPESSGGGNWVWESSPCYVSAHNTKHMRLVFEDDVDTNIVTLSVSTYLSNFAENTSKVYRVPNLLGHVPDSRDEYSAYLEFRINNNQLVLYDDYGYEVTDWFLIGYYYWQE